MTKKLCFIDNIIYCIFSDKNLKKIKYFVTNLIFLISLSRSSPFLGPFSLGVRVGVERGRWAANPEARARVSRSARCHVCAKITAPFSRQFLELFFCPFQYSERAADALCPAATTTPLFHTLAHIQTVSRKFRQIDAALVANGNHKAKRAIMKNHRAQRKSDKGERATLERVQMN